MKKIKHVSKVVISFILLYLVLAPVLVIARCGLYIMTVPVLFIALSIADRSLASGVYAAQTIDEDLSSAKSHIIDKAVAATNRWLYH